MFSVVDKSFLLDRCTSCINLKSCFPPKPPSPIPEIKSKFITTNEERTEFEFRILKESLKKKMPILGICNGMQLINIFFGGSLHQHLPDVLNSPINHEQPAPKDLPTHQVITEQNTLLNSLVTEDKIMVNSTHHQAIKDLGKGLVISARALDNVVEAIELPTYPFLVGVEWHPEYLNSDLDKKLFSSYVEAASDYKVTKEKKLEV